MVRKEGKFRNWPVPAYDSAGLDKCVKKSLVTCSSLSSSCFRDPRPLKKNAERRSLRKERNFSELEVVPLESEVEVKQGSMKSGVKGAQKTVAWRSCARTRETTLLSYYTSY